MTDKILIFGKDAEPYKTPDQETYARRGQKVESLAID
jgi:hypothetical protein